MGISARSYLTAGVSLTAATAVAFTPLTIPATHHRVEILRVAVADAQLAVTPADIEALIADLQPVLRENTAAVANVVGIPGQSLIGTVDNIVSSIDTVFGGLIGATRNQTIAASLTILKTLSHDAFAMLAENLGLINPAITTTTAQVGELLTTALTGSLQNALVAVVNVANDPLSFANYAGLLTAGVASGELLAGNGLQAIQRLGDGGFEIAGIALKEVAFQFNNAVTGLSALVTQLGHASGSAIVEAVIGAVQALTVAPALPVFNLGSGVAGTVLPTANAGFDMALGGATSIVDSTGNALQSGITGTGARAVALAEPPPSSLSIAEDPGVPVVDSPAARRVQSISLPLAAEQTGQPSVDVVVDDQTRSDDLVADEPAAEDTVAKDAPAGDASGAAPSSAGMSSTPESSTPGETARDKAAAKATAKAAAARDRAAAKAEAARDNQSGDDSADHSDSGDSGSDDK